MPSLSQYKYYIQLLTKYKRYFAISKINIYYNNHNLFLCQTIISFIYTALFIQLYLYSFIYTALFIQLYLYLYSVFTSQDQVKSFTRLFLELQSPFNSSRKVFSRTSKPSTALTRLFLEL